MAREDKDGEFVLRLDGDVIELDVGAVLERRGVLEIGHGLVVGTRGEDKDAC